MTELPGGVLVGPRALARSLAVVGDRWSLQIVAAVMSGVQRFTNVRDQLGVSSATLADRLAKLVGEGVLATAKYRSGSQRVRDEYWVTAKGWRLREAVVALSEWGSELSPNGDAPTIDCRAVHGVGELLVGLGNDEPLEQFVQAHPTVSPSVRAGV